MPPFRHPYMLAMPFDEPSRASGWYEDSGAPGERLLGRRILIVEDEAMLAMDLEFTFEDEGAEILGPALSLDAAQKLIDSEPEIDAAVLDVDVGGHDVFPVASRLVERGVPIVFHTGHGSREELDALFPGAVTCTKPTLPAELVMQLRRLTGS